MMNHSDIDQQVRAALRVDPSPEQVARLERFWQQQSRTERHRGMRRRLALAASIVVAATVSAWLWTNEPSREPIQAKLDTPLTSGGVNPTPSEPRHATVSDPPRVDNHWQTVGRPPTTYERLVFVARTGRPVRARELVSMAMVDNAIEKISQDPAADVKTIALSEGLMGRHAEGLLLHRLQSSADEEKGPILQLLAVCGSPNSIARVLEVGRRQALRAQAVVTVEKVVGIAGVADVVRQASDPHVRAALMHRLLTAHDELALRGYLSLLRADPLCTEALAVAGSLPELPLAPLLALLDDEDKTVRSSAAMVLGHVNGPEVTKSLISLVLRESPDCTEAWMALLACRGKLAEDFLSFANLRPQLLGHINSARMQLARMIP